MISLSIISPFMKFVDLVVFAAHVQVFQSIKFCVLHMISLTRPSGFQRATLKAGSGLETRLLQWHKMLVQRLK